MRTMKHTVLCFTLVTLMAMLTVPALAAESDEYQGKVAVITGTSSGLGKALAKVAAKKDMKLVLVDINLAPSTKLAERIREDGGEAEAVRVDLAKREQRQRVIDTAMERFGRIDYLFNNAGYTYLARLEQMDLDRAHHLFEVNYWAYVDLAHRVIPIMKKQGGGTILNVASILGHRPAGAESGLAHYVATKHALVGMFKTAAAELEPHGIRVRIASPGGIATNIAWNSVGPLAEDNRHRADDWEDPMIVARDIFRMIPQDDVVFHPGYIGDRID